MTTFLSSVIVFVTTLMDATRIRSFTFWLLGDLSGATKTLLPVAIGMAVVGTVALTLNARSLNLLMLGERDAFDLGVEVGRVRVVVFLVASLLVGSSVAASGSVGYVGLVVPHLARLSLGSDNRISIPAAALGGALFVIVADTVARTIIAPRELPVGAITALIGAPLLVRCQRGHYFVHVARVNQFDFVRDDSDDGAQKSFLRRFGRAAIEHQESRTAFRVLGRE